METELFSLQNCPESVAAAHSVSSVNTNNVRVSDNKWEKSARIIYITTLKQSNSSLKGNSLIFRVSTCSDVLSCFFFTGIQSRGKNYCPNHDVSRQHMQSRPRLTKARETSRILQEAHRERSQVKRKVMLSKQSFRSRVLSERHKEILQGDIYCVKQKGRDSILALAIKAKGTEVVFNPSSCVLLCVSNLYDLGSLSLHWDHYSRYTFD